MSQKVGALLSTLDNILGTLVSFLSLRKLQPVEKAQSGPVTEGCGTEDVPDLIDPFLNSACCSLTSSGDPATAGRVTGVMRGEPSAPAARTGAYGMAGVSVSMPSCCLLCLGLTPSLSVSPSLQALPDSVTCSVVFTHMG